MLASLRLTLGTCTELCTSNLTYVEVLARNLTLERTGELPGLIHIINLQQFVFEQRRVKIGSSQLQDGV